MGSARTQVLVVGAGPVGLIAALRLVDQGVQVRIVERERSDLNRTFPVVLHPQSLRLLGSLGTTSALFWRGRPITRLAVYTDGERRASLELPRASSVAPGALTLPQDVLRQALLNALGLRGVFVEWGTELAALEQSERGVSVRLLIHARQDGGAPVVEQLQLDADFAIGADGYESTVRKLLGIELTPRGALQSYAFFDAQVAPIPAEAQLVLSEGLASAVYALSEGRARFSYQLTDGLDQLPQLERLRQLTAARLPWFRSSIDVCEWSGVAEFRPALVQHFGVGRVWLAGDAAHITGPLGVQSMNVGLDEGSELALRMTDALRRSAQPSFGQAYEARRMAQWLRLLALETAGSFENGPAWLERELPQLLAALPASDRDLDYLLEQLRAPALRTPLPAAAAARG